MAEARPQRGAFRQRDTPILTFINKMDREGKEPLALLDEIEQELGMPCVPMTWPVGQGKAFGGIVDLRRQQMRLFKAGAASVKSSMLCSARSASCSSRWCSTG